MKSEHFAETDIQLLTLSEASALLGISAEKLRQWIAEGYLDAYPSVSSETASDKTSPDLLACSEEQDLCLDATQVAELAERLAWGRLGMNSWMQDEE